MKKCVVFLLAAILVLTVFSVTAFASGGNDTVTVSVEASSESITILDKDGTQPLTLTFHVTNNTNRPITGMTIKVSGIEPGKIEYANHQLLAGAPNEEYVPGSNTYGFLNANITDTEWDAFSLQLSVKSAAASSVGYTFASAETKLSFESAIRGQAINESVVVNVKHGPDAHDWQHVSDQKAATCTEDGVENIKCSVCQAEDTRPIKAQGHALTIETPFVWTVAEGNASATAKATVKCSNTYCTEYYNDGQGEQVNVIVEDPVTKGATCTEGGTITFNGSVSIYDPVKKTDTKGTDSKEVSVDPEGLGHLWDGEVTWSGWDESAPTSPVTASLTCTRCKAVTIKSDPIVPVKDEKQSKAATCTTDGKEVYTATADFTGKDSHTVSGSKVPTAENNSWEIVKKASGHTWAEKAPTVVWTGDATKGTRSIVDDTKINATCMNPNHDGDDGTLTIKYAKKDGSTEPTCTTAGKVTYVATGVTKDGKGKYTFEDEEQTLPALGHDFGKNEPNVNWPVDFPRPWLDKTGKLDVPADMKVTLHCENEDKDVEGKIIEINETEEIKPTYAEDGKVTVELKAQFSDGKNGTVDKTATKIYTMPKLALPEPSAKVPSDKVGADAQKNLAASADSIVEDVLKGGEPAGVPDAIVQAINEAAGSTEAGSMSISTQLTVADSSYTGTDVAVAYDISIVMTVEGKDAKGEDVKESANISHVAQPIEIKLPKGDAGPIVKVVHIANGKQEPVSSKVVGDDVVFSAQNFSTYAILSSSSLADATVTVDPEYAYTGSVVRPVVKVTVNGGAAELKEGTDYELAVEGDAIQPGDYKVTIKGIGSYTGSVEKTFTVLEPPATAAPTATPVPTATPAPTVEPTAAPTDAPAPTAAPTSAPAATNAPAVPATGDETPVMLYATVLTVCAAALALVLVSHRRREK